jgi:hypothetical protein
MSVYQAFDALSEFEVAERETGFSCILGSFLVLLRSEGLSC